MTYSKESLIQKVKAALGREIERRYGSERFRQLKTVHTMESDVRELTRLLYDGEIDVTEFTERMESLIDSQFNDAFERGAQDVEYDGGVDEVDALLLFELIAAQVAFIPEFANDIVLASEREIDIKPLLSRAFLWALRYDEVANAARVHFAFKQDAETHLMWMLGATEQHCSTCMMLDRTVATASQWLASGYKPQNAPNPMLECGGWRCDCKLEVTEDDLTPGGIPL